MTRMGRIGVWAASAVLVLPGLLSASTRSAVPKDLNEKVRHELVMLPFYSVFDNLQYKVDGNTVTLFGQVARPVMKQDAGTAVRSIPGVTEVVNQIQVLPVSPFDWQIRRAEARAIYGNSVLSRYNWGPVPPIHIIVDNGHVTLIGVVDNQMDRNIAGIQANAVPGVFSVDNRLQIKTS